VLSPHPASALEYWFFKVNAGPVALLVDWIARRRMNENWLRVSVHSPHKRAVLFEKQSSLFTERSFSAGRTVGQIEDVAWELEIDPSGECIAPDIFPAKLLRMPDSSSSARRWRVHRLDPTGEQRTQLQRAPGMMSHYWGRQLAPSGGGFRRVNSTGKASPSNALSSDQARGESRWGCRWLTCISATGRRANL
jgi:hypothetical protein